VVALHTAQAAGVKHFVLLSAICVQKPLLVFQQAKLAFENALRNNPNYATAHENMGDILLHLARQSFAKSAQLDPSAAKSSQQKMLALDPILQPTLNTTP
jgi:hypothetical protein